MSFQAIPFGGDSSDQRAWENRRASVRYRCGPATVGRVNIAEKHEFLRAWVLDLSARGVGLIVPRPLDIGQLVIITMKSTATQRTYKVAARVAHVTVNLVGECIAGFELTNPLSEEDLDALL